MKTYKKILALWSLTASHIKITDESKAIAASAVGAPEPDDLTYWIPYVAHASETVVLEEVENMEERVYTASLQVKVRQEDSSPFILFLLVTQKP